MEIVPLTEPNAASGPQYGADGGMGKHPEAKQEQPETSSDTKSLGSHGTGDYDVRPEKFGNTNGYAVYKNGPTAAVRVASMPTPLIDAGLAPSPEPTREAAS